MYMYFNNCMELNKFLTYTSNLNKDITFYLNNSQECKKKRNKVFLENYVL